MKKYTDVKIYSNGIVHCSVCAPKSLTKEQIEESVNLQNMTGISSHWTVSDDKFRDGGENPGQCENDPKRFHYLMVC